MFSTFVAPFSSSLCNKAALQSSVPNLTRSSLHRRLTRFGINRLPDLPGDKQPKKKFKSSPIGYLHIDIAEVRSEEGKLYLFVAIARTSKFVYVELLTKYGKLEAAQFLRNLLKTLPYKIHKVLADKGIQFTNRSVDKYAWVDIFDRVCHKHGIEHRLTRINSPWTNGQVEHINRNLKEATAKRYHYDTNSLRSIFTPL